MIITIDGYSNQGKSYIGRTLAKECGLEFLSTGNLVRYVAVQYNRIQDGTKDPVSVLQQAVNAMKAATMEEIVNCDNLKTTETEKTLQLIAQHPFVYDEGVQVVIRYAENRNILLDGRFTFQFIPNAHRYYYFRSSIEWRTRLAAKAKKISYEEALEVIAFRDSFEPQCTVPSYVQVIMPELFESTEALLAFMKDDIYNKGQCL